MQVGIISRGPTRNGNAGRAWERSQSYDVVAAAYDPQTPEATLMDIILRGKASTVNIVATNYGASEKVMTFLLDNGPTVRQVYSLAANLSATTGILDRIYRSTTRRPLQSTILRHPNVGVDILVENLEVLYPEKWNWDDRFRAAVKNPETPVQNVYKVIPYIRDRKVRARIRKRRKELNDYFMAEHGVETSSMPEELLIALL